MKLRCGKALEESRKPSLLSIVSEYFNKLVHVLDEAELPTPLSSLFHYKLLELSYDN